MNPLTRPGLALADKEKQVRQRALERGIAAAVHRGSGLLLYAGILRDWNCAYPPAGLTVDGAAEWARLNSLILRPGDSYWSDTEVAAANHGKPSR